MENPFHQIYHATCNALDDALIIFIENRSVATDVNQQEMLFTFGDVQFLHVAWFCINTFLIPSFYFYLSTLRRWICLSCSFSATLFAKKTKGTRAVYDIKSSTSVKQNKFNTNKYIAMDKGGKSCTFRTPATRLNYSDQVKYSMKKTSSY